MTDPIADLLTRIRNALLSRHETVSIPSSRLKLRIAQILKEKGYVSQIVVEEAKPQSKIKIFLKYDKEKKSAIQYLARVSRPGRRIYKGFKEVKPTLRGMGLTILSTPNGVLTDQEARRQKVGGEVLCEVW